MKGWYVFFSGCDFEEIGYYEYTPDYCTAGPFETFGKAKADAVEHIRALKWHLTGARQQVLRFKKPMVGVAK